MRIAVVAALLLVACGKQGELAYPVPAGTKPPPVDPANLPSKLLQRTPQEEPARVDDPLKKSEERRDDRFNLPPPG